MQEFEKRRSPNGIGFRGVSNCGAIPIKTERNKEAKSITGTAVLKVQEGNRIMDLYMEAWGIPEKTETN